MEVVVHKLEVFPVVGISGHFNVVLLQDGDVHLPGVFDEQLHVAAVEHPPELQHHPQGLIVGRIVHEAFQRAVFHFVDIGPGTLNFPQDAQRAELLHALADRHTADVQALAHGLLGVDPHTGLPFLGFQFSNDVLGYTLGCITHVAHKIRPLSLNFVQFHYITALLGFKPFLRFFLTFLSFPQSWSRPPGRAA